MKTIVGVAIATLAMLGFAITQLSLRTDVTYFLPEGERGTARVLTRAIASSDLSRAMVLAVGARDPAMAREAAATLAEAIQQLPAVEWARTGPGGGEADDVFSLYFSRRHFFLSDAPDDPERGLAPLVSDTGLGRSAADWKRRMAGPGPSVWKRLAPEDPLGAFFGILERIRGLDPGVRIEGGSRGGQFVSRDGTRGIVLVQTRPTAFDTREQAPLLAAIEAEFEGIRARFPEAGLVLESSGVNRFAVRIEKVLRRDTARIALVSLVGIGLLFLFSFRSPLAIVPAMLPALLGVLTATCIGILALGDIDVLTLAFGAALTGVSIDYAIHLVVHHGMEGGDATETARRLAPTIGLGAATTMASFAGLALTDFPGFREMGLFSITGIAVALAVTLLVLPRMIRARSPSALANRSADALVRTTAALGQRRALILGVAVIALAMAAVGLPRLRFSDDLRGLSQLDPELMAEDERVRSYVSRFDASRLIVVRAPDEPELLRRNAAVYRRLDELREAGALGGMRSLHELLWPVEVQRRNRERLAHEPGLRKRLEDAFGAQGFRAGAFEPFFASLSGPAPPVLSLTDLRASSLAPVVGSLAIDTEPGLAALTYLRGAPPDATLEAAIEGIPGAELFDHRAIVDGIFGGFRATTLRQMAVGSGLVVLVLVLRYRRLRPTVAAFLPSVAAALLVLSLLGLAGIEANLLHVVSLLLVMGMGVDYGIFVVDGARSPASLRATLLSLLLSCTTTVFVFGTLAISSHPGLRAIGVTTGLGIVLSFLLAPLAWAVLFRGDASPESPSGGEGA